MIPTGIATPFSFPIYVAFELLDRTRWRLSSYGYAFNSERPSMAQLSISDETFLEILLAPKLKDSLIKLMSYYGEVASNEERAQNKDAYLRIKQGLIEQIEAESEAGREAVKLRKTNRVQIPLEVQSLSLNPQTKPAKWKPSGKTKPGTYAKPKFFSDNKGVHHCGTCGENINSRNCFKHKIDGQYVYYHPLPHCFPAEHVSEMENDRDFVREMASR